MSPEIVAGLVGAAATAILATLNSYLSSRAQVAEEVRKARLERYPHLWRLTSLLSTWPRTDFQLEHLERLHHDLRRWYYDIGGGLYMSENARNRYGEVQTVLGRVVANFGSLKPSNGRPSGATYKDLEKACSALRTALTEDLETRGQRSVLRSIRLVWRHRWQWFQAKRRLARAGRLSKEPARSEVETWQRPAVPEPQDVVAKPPEEEPTAVTGN